MSAHGTAAALKERGIEATIAILELFSLPALYFFSLWEMRKKPSLSAGLGEETGLTQPFYG